MAQKENWEIVLTKPAEKTYDKAPVDIRKRFDDCFGKLEKNPLYGNNIKPLTGQLKGLYRYRVGDWRMIYRPIKEKLIIEIIAILPRGEAYN